MINTKTAINNKLQQYYERMSELHRLRCIDALLGWDQRVYMPPGGSKDRADLQEYISLAIHRKFLDTEFGNIVDDLYDELESLSIPDRVNIRETKRALDIERKLPEEFVAESAKVSTISYGVWEKARPANDFQAVKPYLEKLFELAKQRCDLLGYDENPYDALLDLYDPGAKTSITKPLLTELADNLKEIIPPISNKFAQNRSICTHLDPNVQGQLCARIAGDLGFSFENGRIDVTAHPFMTTISPSDVRITTRFNSENFLEALYSTIHETGHALYELGLPKEYAGMPMGEAVSLSIHESQSRLWENLIGRSKEFIKYLSRIIPEYIPNWDETPDELWKQVNSVKPSLIRTEADEVTYSQHVVIRMILEEAVINNRLSIDELPAAWADLYEEYLGIRPIDYKDGVMQDVHWYQGAIGYFPTYALGNLYNAMMMESLKKDIPNLFQQIEQGEFSTILAWLRENVHKHGMRYRGPELIKKITGNDLNVKPFVNYLKDKFLSC